MAVGIIVSAKLEVCVAIALSVSGTVGTAVLAATEAFVAAVLPVGDGGLAGTGLAARLQAAKSRLPTIRKYIRVFLCFIFLPYPHRCPFPIFVLLPDAICLCSSWPFSIASTIRKVRSPHCRARRSEQFEAGRSSIDIGSDSIFSIKVCSACQSRTYRASPLATCCTLPRHSIWPSPCCKISALSLRTAVA